MTEPRSRHGEDRLFTWEGGEAALAAVAVHLRQAASYLPNPSSTFSSLEASVAHEEISRETELIEMFGSHCAES